MSEINIFEVTPPAPQRKWFSFEKVGDAVQGVYVGKSTGVDTYNNEQFIYELFDKKNNVINLVGVKKTKLKITEHMDKVSFGQIVGFVRMADQQTKDTKAVFHVIEVREDPKYVDREWIEQYKARNELSASVGSEQSLYVPDEENYSAHEDKAEKDFNKLTENEPPFLTESEQLKKIAELADKKLGATSENVRDKVMEATNLPFLKQNYEEIINRLELI